MHVALIAAGGEGRGVEGRQSVGRHTLTHRLISASNCLRHRPNALLFFLFIRRQDRYLSLDVDGRVWSEWTAEFLHIALYNAQRQQNSLERYTLYIFTDHNTARRWWTNCLLFLVLRPSSSSVCRLWRYVLWLNGASYSKSCYWQPIGSRIWEIDWYRPMYRPWITLTFV